ncbi:MAG TPA: hypothetical protein VGS97_18825 [Actinocrinis sp.]|uniref:hypothetical protein n=1 Tax=Actinocrinis sp. TaxID=1920516 RepID=UPI002DDDBB79|nr:hypothetical protein [Actinocrinis sp.]HEV2346160.1 hypothetical protein [Actinocrinis sp.]
MIGAADIAIGDQLTGPPPENIHTVKPTGNRREDDAPFYAEASTNLSCVIRIDEVYGPVAEDVTWPGHEAEIVRPITVLV